MWIREENISPVFGVLWYLNILIIKINCATYTFAYSNLYALYFLPFHFFVSFGKIFFYQYNFLFLYLVCFLFLPSFYSSFPSYPFSSSSLPLLPQMSRPVQLQICGRVMSLPPPSCPVAVLTPPLLWPHAPPPKPSPFPTVFSPSTAVSDAEKESTVLLRPLYFSY